MRLVTGSGFTLINGDCRAVLAKFGAGRFDSVVCDPPYELGFMGKKWDGTGIANDPALWAEVLRVLKPGGHLLAFGGTRTYHRMTCAIEDAGFEIRDCLTWNYKTGFPKSLNVSKAIDTAAGETQPVIVEGASGRGVVSVNALGSGLNVGFAARPVTAPVTAAAAAAAGLGTALKPSLEPIVLARKPLIGTVARNYAAHGTGALNIDACRIGIDLVGGGGASFGSGWAEGSGLAKPYAARPVIGRWPANSLFDDNAPEVEKYFFCAKPSRAERDQGCESLTPRTGGEATDRVDDSKGTENPRAGAGRTGGARNFHPTVKPVALMRYLVRLVTPLGGTVLDPFTGSGTTGMAARLEGRGFLGIELGADYFEIAKLRIESATPDAEAA